MDKATKADLVAKWGRKPGDTGSPEVQIAILSTRISELTEHLKLNAKDHSTRRGLLAMVTLRKKLLAYLLKNNRERYLAVTKAFDIRRAK